MTWVIRKGTERGKGDYWSATHNYSGDGLWLSSRARAFKYETYQAACVVLGNLSDVHTGRVVRLRTPTRCVACGATNYALVTGRPLCADAFACHERELRVIRDQGGTSTCSGYRRPLPLPGPGQVKP